MSEYDNFFYRLKQTIFTVFLVVFIVGCAPKSSSDDTNNEQPELIGQTEQISPIKETPSDNTNSIDGEETGSTPIENPDTDNPRPINIKEVRNVGKQPIKDIKPTLNADDYKVVLDVTDSIEIHKKGSLRVWIGLEKYMPKQSQKMARDTTSIPSDVGSYARITPYAPDFEVDPIEGQCIKIHPSGSSVLFSLVPIRKGAFQISAKIELFDTDDCSGAAIPKSSDIVSVLVIVDKKEAFKKGIGELLEVVWKNFLTFWGAFVATIFGALLFVIRRYVKKKAGYGEEINKKEEQETPPTAY